MFTKTYEDASFKLLYFDHTIAYYVESAYIIHATCGICDYTI